MHSLATVFVFAVLASACATAAPAPKAEAAAELAGYPDYTILPGSASPDERFAFIYPRQSRLDAVKPLRLYLVAQSPFRVLKEVPMGDNELTRGPGSYEVQWAKNSSAVMFTQGSKWGPNRVHAVTIIGGKAGRISDLTAAIRKELQPFYKKAKVSRFNDTYDFIFATDEESDRWSIDDTGHVTIHCTCTNSPNASAARVWTAQFHGVYELATAHFVRSEIKTRISHP